MANSWMVATLVCCGSAALAGSFALFRVFTRSSRSQRIYDSALRKLSLPKIQSLGSVRSLKITPIIDFYAERSDLKTEPAVSYYIQADETAILMDLGLNQKAAHPSPFLENLAKLKLSLAEVKYLFISHNHLDHVGGYKEMKAKTFAVSQGTVNDLSQVTVYAPERISASKFNSVREVIVADAPMVISRGVASMGSIARYLFLAGKTMEQTLAVNVEGKGIVLVVGCGHPSIERILDRAKQLFDEPIYAVVGGLHYPVHGGRLHVGPINVQWLLASSEPPWNGLGEKDVEDAIQCIQRAGVQRVALSPHDSSDWTLNTFRKHLAEKFEEIKVGKQIVL